MHSKLSANAMIILCIIGGDKIKLNYYGLSYRNRTVGKHSKVYRYSSSQYNLPHRYGNSHAI